MNSRRSTKLSRANPSQTSLPRLLSNCTRSEGAFASLGQPSAHHGAHRRHHPGMWHLLDALSAPRLVRARLDSRLDCVAPSGPHAPTLTKALPCRGLAMALYASRSRRSCRATELAIVAACLSAIHFARAVAAIPEFRESDANRGSPAVSAFDHSARSPFTKELPQHDQRAKGDWRSCPCRWRLGRTPVRARVVAVDEREDVHRNRSEVHQSRPRVPGRVDSSVDDTSRAAGRHLKWVLSRRPRRYCFDIGSLVEAW